MKIAFFSTKRYDRRFFDEANQNGTHTIQYFEPRLTPETAPLAAGYDAVCVFVNDHVNKDTLCELAKNGTKLIALRCAGFNNVDLNTAAELGIGVVRVPAYSPHGVAEFTVGMILALNRKIYRSYQRVRDWNMSLEGLLGFDMNNRVVGVIGVGKIGRLTAKLLSAFGCQVLAYDPYPPKDAEQEPFQLVELNDLLARSDIVTLHCPLSPDTHHLINQKSLSLMKEGSMLINTSRGALIDTVAVIEALKSGRLGSLGMDVYEEEDNIFFKDLSGRVIQDDVFARLLTFPNVLITGHQAFFTKNALEQIAMTTLDNITEFETSGICKNEVKADRMRS